MSTDNLIFFKRVALYFISFFILDIDDHDDHDENYDI